MMYLAYGYFQRKICIYLFLVDLLDKYLDRRIHMAVKRRVPLRPIPRRLARTSSNIVQVWKDKFHKILRIFLKNIFICPDERRVSGHVRSPIMNFINRGRHPKPVNFSEKKRVGNTVFVLPKKLKRLHEKGSLIGTT